MPTMPDNAASPQPAAADAPMRRARVHALRPGTWPASPADITITADDIAALAAAYDPAHYRAPVVIGHPETDSPAWGWVLGAEALDEGLWLSIELAPELADLVEDRRYGAVSLAMWPPQAAGNPTPGAWSIKHLGFLGAVPPAVKGLQRVQMAAGDAVSCAIAAAAVSLADPPPPTFTTQHAETPIMPEQQPDAVQLAERERKLTDRERELADQERQLAEREQTLRRAQYAAELEPHVNATRVLAAERDTLVEIMERLADAAPVTLAEGGTQGALAAFRAFLARLPARVETRQLSAPDESPTTVRAAAVKVPAGLHVSEAGQALHDRAATYMAAHPGTDYLTAVRAVERA